MCCYTIHYIPIRIYLLSHTPQYTNIPRPGTKLYTHTNHTHAKTIYRAHCSSYTYILTHAHTNLGGAYDEEGQYIPHSPDESESESGEDEEEEESAEHEHFGEVTEVRFPGEVGPLGDRRLCKIRCVKGKWVGPLCATNEEGTFFLLFALC